ncbi:uncharacterized protein SETTUDRAFT_170982 [Exserohilum turcica Et28A]|uniref:BZIP domain-containing protein n=1 Tax=Exserohilum turcicum (strain 28A) TaxID=671987 RepID=R0INJ7_EXST2|nr:uncharacterized protein SETTUDRAFT_170982 [Exserohilum turcica Et28A]EOA86540.1 hypothetical protein SETTUDRAFT_170982 [Exserohilum turcica Et28A]
MPCSPSASSSPCSSSTDHTSDTPAPRSRRARVSAEHTLNRVRENQRRHRARQRDHVASLEQKLAETEKLLAEARAEIAMLRQEATATPTPTPTPTTTITTLPPPTTGPPPCCSDPPSFPPPANQPVDLECSSCKTRPPPAPTESTTLCAQAYVMIRQQNFRNLDPDTIRLWLAQGLRRAQREGEGCRVENGALLRLLDFISGL